MAATEYNPWDEIERWFLVLWTKGQKNDRTIRAYRRMVKAFEEFKELVKKKDFHESEE